MPSFFDLLFAYGICFGLMNKVDVLRKIAFFDRMLSCSYCTGFHAGWIAWGLSRAFHGFDASVQGVAPVVAWAFASSAFCYLSDVASQAAERFALSEKA